MTLTAHSGDQIITSWAESTNSRELAADRPAAPAAAFAGAVIASRAPLSSRVGTSLVTVVATAGSAGGTFHCSQSLNSHGACGGSDRTASGKSGRTARPLASTCCELLNGMCSLQRTPNASP